MGKDQDLIQAVKTNDVGTVRKLLGKITSSKSKKAHKKLNINIQDEDGFTALHHTALMGNSEIAMALLEIAECNVNARDKKGMSPLHLASWAGKTEIAKLLVNYRACVNTCADTGDTPLHLACQHHNAGVVEILLDTNVDCAVVNKNGESALDLACRFGHVQVVELLLKCKDFPKLLALFEDNPRTADPPLHVACKTGREEIVVMLLDAGADVNQRGTNGTALHEASLYGKTEVVKILLDNEADVSITNEEGYTPLDVVNHFTSSTASQNIKDLLRDASKSKVITAKAVHDYRNLYDPTCLSLKVGDTVEILEKNDNGRWKGKVKNGNREIVGYFPSTMVKLMNPKKTSVSGKPLSLKDVGVLPIGKYEMVTLPTAAEQSSPVHDKRPRMSSFGKPNDRAPPSQAEREHPSPKQRCPNPLTNGIKDNRLFQKTQESLQYVEIAVDKSPVTSPASIKSPTGSRHTEYAEVVLRDELCDSNDQKAPPTLPEKKFKVESHVAKNENEDGDDIWIKNSPGQPELPPKGRPPTPKKDSSFEFLLNNNDLEPNAVIAQEISVQTNTKKNERKLKDWEKDLDLEEEKFKHKSDLSTSSGSDSHKSIDNNTDTLKPNYEDMTLNTIDKQETLMKLPARKDHYSPTKREVSENDGRVSLGLNRKLLSYENVELKPRPKDLIQSMLITEVDQDVEESSSYNYENMTKGFEKELPSKNKSPNQDYEQMLPEDEFTAPKYETMKRGVSVEDLTSSQQSDDEENPGLTSDSYENVDIKASSLTGPSNYLTVTEPASPSHGYINIKVPVLPEGTSQASPVQPSGITMNEYNALCDWLESCKLPIYIDNFVKGGFDMISITGLTPEDLTAINITKTGHRKKLLSDSAKQKLPDGVFPSKRPADIMTWLRLIHLDQYTPQLMDNGFDDMEFVQDITMEDLESIGIAKPGHQRKLWLAVTALNSTVNNPPVQQYLETDLDMVHENNLREEKEREIRNTDIDSALSRLPADGASELCFADEEVKTVVRNTKKETSTQIVDNAVAMLHIESLDETRGSTPDLDTILDTMDDEGHVPFQVREEDSVAASFQIPPHPPQIVLESSSSLVISSTETASDEQTNNENTTSTVDCTNSSETQNSQHQETTASEFIQTGCNHSVSISETPGLTQPTTVDTRPKETVKTSRNSSRLSTESSHNSKPACDDAKQSEPTETSNNGHVTADLQVNSRPSDDLVKSAENISCAPLRARHNSMENKTSDPSNQERLRGLSFDSKVSRKPPPPVKPKSFKKLPLKTSPKPQDPLSGEVGGRQEERGRLDRRYTTGTNARPRQPPPVLPKTRHGSVHSTSSEGSIDSVVEELEHQKYCEERRKSFEQLRKRFADQETDSSSEEKLDSRVQDSKVRADSEGLQEQIKEVFRRSRENLVEPAIGPDPVKEPSRIETTDEDELERDQQITDNLMKDINSMLSDFSTEIDCMFDPNDDKSTSV